MLNHPTQTRKSMDVLRILALIGLALALAVPAAAECKIFKLDVPDPDTLKLQDGEHMIAAVQTDHGKLEARVSVKGKRVSESRFFMGGKPLSPTSESQIPQDIRDCIQKGQRAALPSGNWLANAVRSTLDWIVPTAYAATPKCVVTATCSKALDGKYYCVAYACCGSTCIWHSGIY